MQEIFPTATPVERLADLLEPGRYDHLASVVSPRIAERLEGRAVVNVNSTAQGGGVAEMLHGLVPLARSLGVDARWVVIDGTPEFFAFTKRLHNLLHGDPGDGRGIADGDRARYESVAADNARELRTVTGARDIVVLHDPQTAGMAPHCAAHGNPVVWRCHIGVDSTNEHAEAAWQFLRAHLDGHVDAYVFTREQYAPAWVPRERLHVIPPSIDPLAPKNVDLAPDEVVAILQHVGLVAGRPEAPPCFRRPDGSTARIHRFADLIGAGPAPQPDEPLVVQVSRWDQLKDPVGVLHGFADHVVDGHRAHLVLAGPAVTAVADDPEAADVLERCWVAWRSLPHATRAQVVLACLPMADGDENATIVNALQRHASVIVQKSTAEGFGLTVTEAAYKGRPVVASAVGGIVDQIEHNVSGLLLDDPTDLAGFGRLVKQVLDDPALARRLGAAGQAKARAEFLPDCELTRWGTLLEQLLTAR
jgi:trehalose synthase